MRNASAHRWLASIGGAGAIWVLAAWAVPNARGGDLVTLAGTTYHDVRPVLVEPDGVTWQHAGGICKVDFADSPLAVRETYHYDAAKATAYHDAQVQARRQNEEQSQVLMKAHEDRKEAQVQTAFAAASGVPATAENELIFRRAASPAASAATRALAEQIAVRSARQTANASGNESIFVSPKLWSILPRIGTYHPTHFFEVPNAEEYKSNIHHAPGGFAPDSIHDEFYTPMYMTKSYYDELDRSAAFLRGVPLKP